MNRTVRDMAAGLQQVDQDQPRPGRLRKLRRRVLSRSGFVGLLRFGLNALRRAFSRIRRQLDPRLVTICRRFGFLASLYYAFWSRAFMREHRAMLEGRHRYAAEVATPAETSALLRRNTHRLEKGLLMRPRRNSFALDFVGETVACYEKIINSNTVDAMEEDTELRWAHDVLSEYFAVTIPDPRSDEARRRFEAITHRCNTQRKLVPYRRNLDTPSSVSYEQLLSLAQRRRSVRWFRDLPVPRESVDRAVAIAAQSPSACNRQPFVFRIFDDAELVRQVADIPMGTPGFAHNIPVMVVVVGQLRAYPHERDRHLIYVDGALAAMSFVLALEAQGLSSCCINWPDVEVRERRMASLLRLERDERPIMCIALGYPDPEGLVAYSQKKPLDQLRRYN